MTDRLNKTAGLLAIWLLIFCQGFVWPLWCSADGDSPRLEFSFLSYSCSCTGETGGAVQFPQEPGFASSVRYCVDVPAGILLDMKNQTGFSGLPVEGSAVRTCYISLKFPQTFSAFFDQINYIIFTPPEKQIYLNLGALLC